MEGERTEREDELKTTAEEEARNNLWLLGFLHQRSLSKYDYSAIPSNSAAATSTGSDPGTPTPKTTFYGVTGDKTLALINSSNGLVLLYRSNSSRPTYLVYNPFSGDNVGVRFAFNITAVARRFMVFGFAFDITKPPYYFTIVQIHDEEDRRFRVTAYSSPVSRPISLPSKWVTTHHKLPALVRDGCALSGPSTFHRGNLHWLFEPSGVVAYDISAKSVSFSLIRIAGDEDYVDAGGFCNCVKKMRSAGMYSNGDCSCRYLGESKDQLVYIRVTGDSQFSMWNLVDYCRGIWSRTGNIVVDNLPASLYFGRALAFDRKEPHLLFLRVKRRIFSYSCSSGELKEICKITKEYGGEENCLGFVIPYELPRVTLCLPSNFLARTSNSEGLRLDDENYFATVCNALNYELADPLDEAGKSLSTLLKTVAVVARSYRNDDGHLHLYRQSGISQLAVSFFPHGPQHAEVDATGPPVWYPYSLKATLTPGGIHDAVVRYNDFIRAEACLYGCTAEPEKSSQ